MSLIQLHESIKASATSGQREKETSPRETAEEEGREIGRVRRTPGTNAGLKVEGSSQVEGVRRK